MSWSKYIPCAAGLLASAVLILGVLSGVSQANAAEEPAIHLQYGSFDPLKSEPAVLVERSLTVPEDGPATYLLQFTGPVLEEWKAAVEEAGIKIYGYVPDYAFLVRADAETIAKVGALPFVRWTGAYHPAYRLATSLQKVGPDVGEPVSLVVQTLPDADLEALAAQVESLGGTLLDRAANEFAGYLRVNLPAGAAAELAALDGVLWVEPYIPPELFNNVGGGSIMRADQIHSSLNLFGSGQIVAVADTGLDVGKNDNTLSADFRGRIVQGSSMCAFPYRTTWNDENGHGTHVAGSVLSSGALSGSNPSAHQYVGSFAGVAPEARLVFQAIDDPINTWLECIPGDMVGGLFGPAYTLGARIHTNSWGGPTGSGQYGGYTTNSQAADQAAWKYKNLLILFAAGNSGTDSSPMDGQVDPDSIGAPGTAKNVITVAASENDRPEIFDSWGDYWADDFPVDPIFSDPIADNSAGMAAFSSRGPTDDGRIKPDIVAPGTFIISARSHDPAAGTGWGEYNGDYLYMGGTSMATPLTAGASALVREWLVKNQGFSNPSSALMKAVLINGAADMSPGQYGSPQEIPNLQPNNVSGWGRVNLRTSLNPPAPRQIWLKDQTTGLGTAGVISYTLTVGPIEGGNSSPGPIDPQEADGDPVEVLGLPAQPGTPEPDSQVQLERLPKERSQTTTGTPEFDPLLASELLENPGFETGSLPPWQAESNLGTTPGVTSSFQHSGSWSANLGGGVGTSEDDIDTLYQEVIIPADASGLSVDFWYRLQTDETFPIVDLLCFGMWNTGGSVIWGNCFEDFGTTGDLGWTQFTYPLAESELAAVAGQTVLFGFQTSNDSSLTSQAWIDDISLSASSDGTTETPSATHTPTPTKTPTEAPPGPSGGPLRVTLAWTDYPGNPIASKALVNNLDLEVIGPNGTHYYGNAGLYASGDSCLRDGKWDRCNNVEGVIIPAAPYGEYTVIVHGVNVPNGPQPFALVASGDNLPSEKKSQQSVFLPLVIQK